MVVPVTDAAAAQVHERALGSHTDTVDVPKNKHGMVIGKGGKILHDIQDRTGTRIIVPDRNSSETKITIVGTRDGVEKAKIRIIDAAEMERDEFSESKYRNLARESMKKKNKYFEDAHDAHERGDGAEAKRLADLGHQQEKLIDEYNDKAMEEIFAAKNNHLNPDEIDLHGLYVDESIIMLERKLNNYKGDELTVVTGAGHHSSNGPKIRPAVAEYLEKHNYKFEEEGPGAFQVRTGTGSIETSPSTSISPPDQQGGTADDTGGLGSLLVDLVVALFSACFGGKSK